VRREQIQLQAAARVAPWASPARPAPALCALEGVIVRNCR
jgi:hypothetical protein